MKEEVQGDFNTPITPVDDPFSRSTPDPDDINAIEALADTVEGEQSNEPVNTPEPVKTNDNIESTPEPVKIVETEPEATEPVTEAPASEQVETKIEQVEEDPLEKEFPTPKHLSPEKKSDWGNLRKRAATFEKKAKELESKYSEAVDHLVKYEKGAALPEPIQKEIEELRQFRRMADIQSDPEFQKEYVQSIVQEEDKLFAMFKEHGMTDEAIQNIIDSGGIRSKSRDEWAKLILASMKGEEYEFAREDIKTSLKKIYETEDRRRFAIQDAAKNFDKYYQEKQGKAQETEKVNYSQMVEEVTRIQKEIPWANEPQKPINPTPEQAKQYDRSMQEWNTHVERFQKGLYSTDPKIRAQTAMAACGYFKLAEDIKGVQAENNSLRQQIQKLQAVGRTNTQTVINTPKPVAQKPKVDFMMDDQAALEQMLKDLGQ